MFPLSSDRLLLWSLRGVAALAGSIVLLILVFLVVEAVPSLRSVGPVRFFGDPSWHPAGGADTGRFTANIALELGYALDHHRSALFVSGLLLMAVVSLLIGIVEWINPRRADA